MADTDLRIKAAAKRYNGAVIAIRECSSDGSSTLTSYFIMPYSDGQGIERVGDTAELLDGSNSTILSSTTLKNYKLKGNFIQVDKATIDILRNALSKTYNVYFYNGVVNGKYQEWFFPICNIDGNFSIELTDWNKVPFVFTSLKNDAIVTTTTVPGVAKATQFATPAEEQCVITETTVTT